MATTREAAKVVFSKSLSRAGGPSVEGSAISWLAAILKATGTAVGIDSDNQTLVENLSQALDYAFDLRTLFDQENLIVIIEADDLNNDASTTQSWFELYRNEGANDDATANAEFQYLALISYASTDVLDQTSFIFT